MAAALLVAALLAAVLPACSATTGGTPTHGGPGSSGPSVGGPSGSSSGSTTTSASSVSSGSSGSSASTAPAGSPVTPPADAAHTLLHKLTLAERVGQLFMIDCPSTSAAPATIGAIQQYGVGSVILDGTSYLSRSATAGVTSALEFQNPSAAKLFIATDQEGGLVQRLRGPGFSSIPSAVVQGGRPPAALRADARQWGQELRGAGVTVDLAPVLDVVPPGSAGNPPIGDLDREYGRDPATVTASGLAVAGGLADAGVDATVKHFPGLGRVAGNTDTTAGVVDTVTTRSDAYLAPFRAAVSARVPFVMISTAIYTRIDPHQPAAFSSTVITTMLRHDLGFTGVVVSDDLGNATQVKGYGIGDRAVRFIAAGGDMVLTVDAADAGPMTAAVTARAEDDPAFARLVDAAALRVLEAKQARGLL